MLHPLNAAEAGRGGATRIPRTLHFIHLLTRTDGWKHMWVWGQGGRVSAVGTVHILRRGVVLRDMYPTAAHMVYGPRAFPLALCKVK